VNDRPTDAVALPEVPTEPKEARTGEFRLDGALHQLDYRKLMRKVEQVVRAIHQTDDLTTTVGSVAAEIVSKLRDDLGLIGGRLYGRRGDSYEVLATFPEAKPVQGTVVPAAYLPIQLVLDHGTVFMAADDPRADRDLERQLGAREFAALEVGDGDYILAFDIARGVHREDVLFSLGILRHGVNQQLQRERIEGIFREARKIQSSILPRKSPTFPGFDAAGAIEGVESVAGDYYDMIPITEKILGLAVADVSGHGLPAALQVRDVHMGLRMGLARDFKIVRTVERLNRIIHESTLTSRFVSLFYGELERNGVFIYVNAGHPPPFHLAADGGVRFLEEGGPVLGPLPEATYERGFVRLQPGDMLVFFTDGIIEAGGRGADGVWQEHGIDRLVEIARGLRGRKAREVVDGIFAAVHAWAGDSFAEDDRTVMVVVAEPR
jgi:sigma-B regulation protein RsbU (phosphoserine phosphatase)